MSLSLPSFVSLFSLLVSAVLGWSVVFHHMCVYVKCTQLSTCLPVFPPSGWLLFIFVFILLLKTRLACTWVLASSLSARILTERISQMRTQQRGQPATMGPGGSFSMSARETGTLRFTPGTSWEWLASRLRKRPASCFFFGRPSRALQVPDALLAPLKSHWRSM